MDIDDDNLGWFIYGLYMVDHMVDHMDNPYSGWWFSWNMTG